MKAIIRCPECEKRGIKQSLAEVLSSGMVSVQRIRRTKNNDIDHTVVGGSSFFLICGNCGSRVYVRQEK